MEKQIPVYFDSVVVSSPLEIISENNKNLGRLQVRVFTKYGNRNGSYITDAVADQLITSAIRGNIPVIGFFDPQTQSWASHTGPTLANAYGYVESFLGWQPFTDTDGITREYAVFSVILFTQYFEEAQKVLGQNQSMELDPKTITGDWALIEDTEYFVYKTAQMLGFCIIGDHEPCFSVSAFFSKNDDAYNNQYDKFSSLLSDLKAQVEEAKNQQKGGEQPMNEFENQEVVEEVIEQFSPETEGTPVEFEVTTSEEVKATEFEEKEVVEEAEVEEKTSDFELLQTRFNELQTSYNELEQRLNEVQAQNDEFQKTASEEINTLRTENAQLQATVQAYEALKAETENNRKNELIEKYEKILTTEEISSIKERANDFSYDELESKLAVMFANKKLAGAEQKKVPLPELEESQFALLMKKYRKN